MSGGTAPSPAICADAPKPADDIAFAIFDALHGRFSHDH